MSWPSFYGYKYTPIGLRQRERKDDSGTRSICTTVHLPQGGHLLDIERQYGIDGSMSKRETQNLSPSAACPVSRPPTRAVSPTPMGVPSDFFEPRKDMADLERQADDIIANFRARQGTGLDSAPITSKFASAGDKVVALSSAKADVTSQEISAVSREESSASSRVRRMLRKVADDY